MRNVVESLGWAGKLVLLWGAWAVVCPALGIIPGGLSKGLAVVVGLVVVLWGSEWTMGGMRFDAKWMRVAFYVAMVALMCVIVAFTAGVWAVVLK